MVSTLDSGSSGLGLSAGQGHCVVFLDKILESLSTQKYKIMDTRELSGRPDKNAGVYLLWTSIPSRVVVIFLVTSCYQNSWFNFLNLHVQ